MVIKTNKLLFLSVIAGSFLASTSTIKCMVTPVGPVLSNSSVIVDMARGVTSKSVSGAISLGKYALKRYRLSGCKDEFEYIKRLLKYGYKEEAIERINKVNKYGRTLICLIFERCFLHDIEIVKLLLPYCTKKTINKADKYGRTSLLEVCSGGKFGSNHILEKVKLLLPHCIKETINRADKYGQTPLYWACYRDSVEIVKLLLPHCTKETINKAGEYDDTPLYWACRNGNTERVKLLLQNDVNIDAKSQEKVKNKLNLKEYIDTVLEYNKTINKVKYILDLKEDKNIEMHELLVRVAFGKAVQSEQDLAIFFKLYNMGKSEVEWEKIFGVKHKLDMFKFIKEVLRDKDKNCFIDDEFLFIKLEEMFKFKSKMNKARKNKAFIDCAIKFSDNVEKTEKKDNSIILKELLKLKRKELRQLIEDLSKQEKFFEFLTDGRMENVTKEEISKVKLKIGQLERNIETVKKELRILKSNNVELK